MTVFKGLGEKNDAVEMQGPYERKNMPPIDMEIVRELNVIGKKDYDQELVFESYVADPDGDSEDEH